MTVKRTVSNGRTMAAGYYNGIRLTNRQAQFVEMLRNGLTVVDCADSFGITQGAVARNLQLAMQANGIAGMREFRERLDLPAVKRGRPKSVKIDIDLDAPPAPKVPTWIQKRRASFSRRDKIEAEYDRKSATQKAISKARAKAAESTTVKPALTRDQAALQLALSVFDGVHGAARALDMTVKECLGMIVDGCRVFGVQPTLDNFLSIK